MEVAASETGEAATPVVRKKWAPKGAAAASEVETLAGVATGAEKPGGQPRIELAANAGAGAEAPEVVAPAVARKKWTPKAAGIPDGAAASESEKTEAAGVEPGPVAPEPSSGSGWETRLGRLPVRKKWEPKKSSKAPDSEQ